jgi:ABC-2 type transport system permease protein
MSEATSAAMGSIVGGAALIKKVYVPKYIFPAEKVLFAFVNMLFSMIALVIMVVLTKMGIIYGSSPDALLLGPTVILSFVPMLYTLVFSMGLGFILAALNVYFRDINHLYSVWVLAWMYLTPVIYPVEMVEPTPIMKVLVLNPMYYYVTYFRSVLMSAEVPDLNFNLICIGTSIAMLIIGLMVFKKNQDRFILFI